MLQFAAESFVAVDPLLLAQASWDLSCSTLLIDLLRLTLFDSENCPNQMGLSGGLCVLKLGRIRDLKVVTTVKLSDELYSLQSKCYSDQLKS